MANNQEVLIKSTAKIVVGFISNNAVPSEGLPDLIASTFVALQATGRPFLVVPDRPVPPVAISKSITNDYLISLEDGKQYKSLKRHLKVRGLSPEQYRKKWSLPWDYPMVAPNYAARRSEVAKSIGLGKQRRKPKVEPAAQEPASAEPTEGRNQKMLADGEGA